MNVKFGFFPYQAMNYKAAQRYLDRQAERGWGLKHIYLSSIALFQRAENPKHFVDLNMRESYEDTDPAYLQLCADTGWEFIQDLRGMLLFRAAQGKSPVPIQTDEEVEWEQFWKKHRPRLWSTLLILLLIGLVFLMLSTPSSRNTTAIPASVFSLVYVLYLALSFLYIILEWLHSRWYLARCRRSGRVESPGRFATVLDSFSQLRTPLGILTILSVVIFWVRPGLTVDLNLYPPNGEYSATAEACREWPVVLSSDLGLPDSEDSRRLQGFRTPLMDFLEYREIASGGEGYVYIHTTERYECLNEALAKWAILNRNRETQKYFLWGDGLPWEPAPDLGFDECYTCHEGSYLLFRQGNVVALVGCTGFDLTTEQSLAAVRARILSGLP